MTNWINVKSRLIPTSPWISAFMVGLDEQIAARLNKINLTRPPPFNPQFVETLLNDISTLLDRVLMYRRDAIELEIIAVKQAVDYKLHLDTKAKDLELATLALNVKQATAQSGSNRNAQKHFAAVVGKDQLAAGLGDQAGGLAEAADATKFNDARRATLLTEKAKIVDEYQDDLNLRHTTPGNAHNFRERYNRVVDFLLEDLDEAYEKALCAVDGLKSVYGLTEPLPAVEATGYLDAFVKWARRAAREIGRVHYGEVEFDYVTSAVSGSPISGRAKYGKDDMDLYLRPFPGESDPLDKQIIFDLKEDFARSRAFSSYSAVRTIGVGASIGINIPSALADRDVSRMVRARLTVLPPSQKSNLYDFGFIPRSPIVIGYAGSLFGDKSVEYETGLHARNIDPRGSWNVAVSRLLHNAEGRVMAIDGQIIDVRLHLRLAGRIA